MEYESKQLEILMHKVAFTLQYSTGFEFDLI
jgi:hypothetical protein